MPRMKGRWWLAKRPSSKVSKKIKLRVAVLVAVGVLAMLSGAALAIKNTISTDLPRIAALKDYKPPVGTRVYTEDDHLLGRIKAEKGIYVPLPQIPENIKLAVLAVEDAKFYKHEGLDFQGILRAIVKDILTVSFREGGSTITQQLAKLMFLTPEKSITRKLREAVLARRMEKELTKDEILELYLNKAYFGHGAYGVELAARTYFGKNVGDLTLAEAAMIAGLLKSPAGYSPYRDFKRARERQAIVLARMVDERFITKGQAEKALKYDIRLDDIRDDEDVAPHLIERIRVYLLGKYGPEAVYVKGLKVRTTINYRMQKAARDALEKGVGDLEARQKAAMSAAKKKKGAKEAEVAVPDAKERLGVQGALVAMDPNDGRILAACGGVDFTRNEFNHAFNARRQPGSAFKPFVYAAAMERGFNPASVIVDEQRSYDNGRWTPENFDRKHRGPITLREALVNSNNVATVELLNMVGVGSVTELAGRLGMKGPFPRDLTLALGSGEVTPLEITAAYCALANGGMYVTPYYLKSVSGPDGKTLERYSATAEVAFSPATAYLVTNMLQDVIARGTGTGASWLRFPVAGKTGTTNDYTDAWFVGYSPGVVAGVWVGYDDQKSLGHGESGSRAALPVWARFMGGVVSPDDAGEFAVPDDVEFAEIDADTGLPPDSSTKSVITEVFQEGEAPGSGSLIDSITPAGIKDWILGE